MPGFTIEYNGVILDEVNIRAYRRVPVMHGPDFLFTKHLVHVTGVFNPGMDGDNTTEVGSKEQELELKLRKPRRSFKLTSFQGGKHETWLEHKVPQNSPIYSDVAQGPKTLDCVVVYFNGTKTYFVDWTFEVHTTEEQLLYYSNRYTISNVVDNRHWTHRLVTGRMVIHGGLQSGRLQNAGKEGAFITPDDLRSFLLLPCPDGYRRNNVTVTLSQDATAYEYSFEDVETPLFPGDPDIADVEHTWEVAVTTAKTDQLGLQLGGLLASASSQISQVPISSQFGGKAIGKGIAGGGTAAAAAISLGMEALAWYDRNLPMVTGVATTTVFGTPRAAMIRLLNTAFKYTQQRVMAPFRVSEVWTPSSVNFTGDLRHKVVRSTIVMQKNNLASAVNSDRKGDPLLDDAARFENADAQRSRELLRKIPPPEGGVETAYEAAFMMAHPGFDVIAREPVKGTSAITTSGKKTLPTYGESAHSIVAMVVAALESG